MDVLKLLRDARLVRSVDGVPSVAAGADQLKPKLKSSEADPQTADYIGLYFWSANNHFTPELKTFYERFSVPDIDAGRRRLEIISVFTEADDVDQGGVESDEDFARRLREMPWLAVANTDPALAKKLRRVLRIDVEKSGALVVIVDLRTGQVVSRSRHSRFTAADGHAESGFPWSLPSLDSLLASDSLHLVSNTCTSVKVDDQVDFKLLYFSANWCPPCKAFTPQLAKTCEFLAADSRAFKLRVIFVSFDRSRESFEQYFGSMPSSWLAMPYQDETRRHELAELLLVQGIPKLMVLDGNNKLVTRDGRQEVTEDPEGKNFPWAPDLVEVLTAKLSSRLKEDPFLVLFTDGNEEELEQAKTILRPIAEDLEARRADDHAALGLSFFVAGEDAVCDSLRDFAQLEDVVPLLVILDTVINEKYVLDDDVELNTDVVRRFVESYLDGSLPPVPLAVPHKSTA